MNEDKSDMATANMPADADTGTTAVSDRAGCKKKRSAIAAFILCAAVVTFGWYLCHEIHEVRDALFLISKVATAPKKDVVQTPLNMGDVRDAISEAERLESSGDHLKAGYYWRNALEHASDAEMLSVLRKYAETLFQAKANDETLYTEATTLERLSELALVRVSPKEMDNAIKLRDRCAAFRTGLASRLSSDLAEEETKPDVPERHPALIVADQVDLLLKELKESIDKYMPSDRREPPKELEYKILQLSGVAESTMSQIWFMDRSGLGESDKTRIDSFPKRLNDEICRFNDAHDKPLLKLIEAHTTSKPPRTNGNHTHQDNIAHYKNSYALASANARELRGTTAQASAQEFLAKLMRKVSDEKRQQMNEYQKFVANCCKLAYDAMSEMNTGFAGYGRVPKDKGYKNEGDFINRYVRKFSANVPLPELRFQTDFRRIYTSDNWIPDALQRSTGGPNYWDVHNEHKAFIITAIYGFYRIDQSLLTPETVRLFNDVFGKYYEKMDAARKAWSVRWMVEEPKIRLEDF